MTIEHPRLLLVDSYDSFTFNLAALCRRTIPNCSIYIIKNDSLTIHQLLPILKCFSAVIISPGPGSPLIQEDIGVVKHLWTLPEDDVLPIFGVCLGLQSLGVEFQAELRRLDVVKHGQISRIHHNGSDIFDGVGEVDAVRYHSLHIIPKPGAEIEPLAWAHDEEGNGSVVMAIRHRTRPFWAVQYHPESVCTEGGGDEVVSNFWRLAQIWSKKRGREPQSLSAGARALIGSSWPYSYTHSPPSSPSLSRPSIFTATAHLPKLTTTLVGDLFGASDEYEPFVMLDSAAAPGRFSIVAALNPSSLRISYHVGESFLTLTQGNSATREELRTGDIWSWIASFMRSRKVKGGVPLVPFWGGLIGYLSYELGVHTMHVPVSANRAARHPDVNLVFVERSVVLDSATETAYIQSIVPDDKDWVHDTLLQLTERCHEGFPASPQPPSQATVTIPNKAQYISRINEAKDHLFAGDSYELCLTAQTRVVFPPTASGPQSSWERYKSLQRKNPAPHSAYIRLHPTTLLSSSPERFLSFSRPPRSVCQLRPIKGTVRKSPEITRAIAEKMLRGSPKEVAENLMIVDLIRHDLHGVVGEDVVVKQFCTVEEYETVWQLVSVIEGALPPNSSVGNDPDSELGWDVLKMSLPPGSMTGAPKKRSVEILQSLEDRPRGIYSGVFGYWCVGGGGDWSVTIRSCFRLDDDGDDTESGSSDEKPEEWVIGAGGAITALSDAEAEWDEMKVKLQSVLRAFGVTLPEEK